MRRLNSPQMQFALEQQLFILNIDILLIQKVKMTMTNLKSIASNLWPWVEFSYSEAEGVPGGVATF